RAQICQISRCHFFDATKLLPPIQSARLKTEHGLLRTQTSREIPVSPKHSPAGAENQKERRPSASPLNFHQRGASGAAVFFGFLPDNFRQLLDGRPLENRRQSQ